MIAKIIGKAGKTNKKIRRMKHRKQTIKKGMERKVKAKRANKKIVRKIKRLMT